MTKKEFERQKLSKEMYRIFEDGQNYNHDELMGYAKLVNHIFEDISFCEDNSILVCGLINAINTLSANEQRVVALIYGINEEVPQTYRAIAKLLSLSPERIRQIKLNALRKLRKHRNASMYVIKNIQLHQTLNSRVREAKTLEELIELTSHTDIMALSMSDLTKYYLKPSNIKTVGQLLSLSEREIINEVGFTAAKELFQEREDLCGSLKVSIKTNIAALKLSSRAIHTLRKYGIYTVKDLISLPEAELASIMGPKTFEEVLIQRKELIQSFS